MREFHEVFEEYIPAKEDENTTVNRYRPREGYTVVSPSFGCVEALQHTESVDGLVSWQIYDTTGWNKITFPDIFFINLFVVVGERENIVYLPGQ